jgi:putative ABC transport system ATP-binding protein
MEKAIACRGITKTYGEGEARVDALKGVDLEVALGELLMIVGPSGSGKTTLISVLSGVLAPTSGECRVLGEDLFRMKNAELTRFRGKNIGFTFQTFNLIPMLTAVENVAVPLLLGGMEHAEALAHASERLIDYGLEEKLGVLPPQLSGGQQQRVAIARSSIHGPKIIVCDEPTSSLDQETGTHVMELFRKEVEEQKCALIIVTHDPRIFDYADRIIRLEDGKIF